MSVLQVPAFTSVQLAGQPAGVTVTIKNLDSNNTVYYGDKNVSVTNYTGTIAPGASSSLDNRGWYLTSSGTGAEVDIELSSSGDQPWEVVVEALRQTVNALSGATTPNLGGDLSGTPGNAVVAKILGAALSGVGTAVAGSAILASSSSAATWVPESHVAGVSVVNAALGAKLNGVMVTDGVMSSASPTLTSASAPFGNAVAGMNVRVQQAGNAGGTQDLVTTILSVQSATQVTLNANCANTGGVSGVTAMFGNNDDSALAAAKAAGAKVRVPAGSVICLAGGIAPWTGELDVSGVTVLHIQNLGQGVISESLSSEPAATVRFTMTGGYWPGTGYEKQNQQPFVGANTSDLFFRDMIVVGNASGAVYVGDFQRARCINCTGIATRNTSGYNVFTFTQLLHGVAGSAPNDLFVYGCYVSVPGVAGICFNSSSAYTALSANFIIALNDVTSGSTSFGPIVVEIGGTLVGAPQLWYGIIIGNVCTQTATTGGAYGVILTNDGSPLSTDPSVIQWVIVALNVINSGRSGVLSQGSYVLIAVNIMNVGTGNGVDCADHNGAGVSHNHVVFNIIAIAANSVGYGIWFGTLHASQSQGNDLSYAANPTGTNPAVYFQNCTDCHSINDNVRGAPAQSWQLSACTDCTVRGGYSLNNGSNGTAIAALQFTGAGNGNNTAIGNYFYDNRTVTTTMSGVTPSISATGTGGTLTAGTYQVEVTYVNSFGETVASASASVAIAAGQNLQVNSPAAVANATGWYAYVTQAGGATYYRQQTAGSPTAIGTNLTLTTNPTNTGANPQASNTTGRMTYCIQNSGSVAVINRANNYGIGATLANTNGAMTSLTAF